MRFCNTALEDANGVYLASRRLYEQQQQGVIKDVLDVASGYTTALQYFSDNLAQVSSLGSSCYSFEY